jgi:superfamily I DNA/RNA helicase
MARFRTLRSALKEVVSEIRVRPDWKREIDDWVRSRARKEGILGPPGTGKTRDAVEAAANAKPPVRVLAFTHSAAAEFRDRLSKLECIEVETVDSLAVRFVGFRNMISVAGNIELGVDLLRYTVAKEQGIRYSLDKYVHTLGNELFGAADYVIGKAGREGLETLIAEVGAINDKAGKALEDYYACIEGRIGKIGKFTCGLYDFTWAKLMLAEYGYPMPVRVGKKDCGEPVTLIVDEVQDMSWLMWMVVIRASGDGVEKLIVAGDPDQAIYSGLHPIALDVFNRITQVGEIVVLKQSHRVPNNIARFAQAYLNLIAGGATWRNWVGTDAFGSIRFVKPEDMLREVLMSYNNFKIFILAPTNKAVVPTAINLMRLGVVPHFLKGVPTPIARLIQEAKEALGTEHSLAEYLGEEGMERSRAEEEYVRVVINLARKRFDELRLSHPDKSASEVWDLVWDEFEPRNLVYDENPYASPFVDTIHTAKGLEADLVFVLNFLEANERDPEPTPNLFYVAATRAKAGVRIVTAPGPGWKPWVDTTLLRKLAQEVVANA